MSIQPGLYSQQNYERFAEEWNETVLREAEKWCRNDEAAHLLTEAVLNDCRHQFATKKPPSEPEYYLRAQVCLVYSMTGQNIERLKSYIQDRPFAEESQVSGKTDDSEVAAETEPLPEMDTGGTEGFEKAQVMAGGTACGEFDPRNMESRKCAGLHVTGELLNVDGDCGGFNLMFAFASGILAGSNGRKGKAEFYHA